jgi:hypothetical protein
MGPLMPGLKNCRSIDNTNMSEINDLNQEQIQRLTALAEDAERELALGVQDQSNRAFNLGCTLWLIPGTVAVIVTFIVSKGNWVIAFFLAVLVSLLAVGFALVSAYNTKNKTVTRLYRETTLPQLVKDLAESQLSQPAFREIALQVLPSDALLHKLLGKLDANEGPGPESADRRQNERN